MHAGSISLVPPGGGGVRDYASLIGSTLRVPVLELTQATDTSNLSGDMVLLHFSSYGFQKRGVPLWLVTRIRSLRSRFGAIGVVFHELFASGPPWGSAFWLSGYQRRIARELLMISDFWLTNRDASARWLLAQRPAAPHRVLPVFSNVGEPATIQADRLPRLVVFGSPDMRANTYQWADGEIFRYAERHGLEIHDIGAAMQDSAIAGRMEQQKVVMHGKLSAQEVSSNLSSAAYGALAYPTDCASKSGVFAAYTAHGMCPILLSNAYEAHDGLVANVHYAAGFGALDPSLARAREIGREARGWYEPHRVEAHADALKTLVGEVVSPKEALQ